ncbi:MAG: methylenetetrahydrofolate reductase [Alphaproteobacteria bacterium]|nr:methylenetetrahydrofolate reductase [Alphaproteobacteria bacterium]
MMPAGPRGFEARLRAGRFVITAEISPPVSSDPEHLLARAMPLAHLADAVNITDSASANVHLSALAAAAILVQHGIEPVLQFTCRDRNRIALQGDLLGAAALGIRNLLLLTGDNPGAGDQPNAKPVFDLDSRALIETTVGIRDRSELPSGRTVAGRADFFIGVADVPLDPPAGWSPVSLQNKIAAGAQFVQTQFCMDGGIARRYLRRLAEEGITERVFVLIGVVPLASARSALWIRDHLPGALIPGPIIDRLGRSADPKREGKRICIELMRELAEVPGVRGVHLMAPRNHAALAEVIAEARSGSDPGSADQSAPRKPLV